MASVVKGMGPAIPTDRLRPPADVCHFVNMHSGTLKAAARRTCTSETQSGQQWPSASWRQQRVMTPYTGPSQLVKALAVAQKVDVLAAFGFFVASPLPEHA